MERIPAPPHTGDGLLFALSSQQCEAAQKSHVAGTNAQRLQMVKSAVPGQPVFLFDTDARVLHGPYAAEGPGGLNLDGVKSSPLPAQLRFSPVVRAFLPLPEAAVADLLSFEGGKGAKVLASTVDGETVGQLLWLFVLHHHKLLDDIFDDDAAPASDLSSGAAMDGRAAATHLADYLRARAGHAILVSDMKHFYAWLGAQGDECAKLVNRATASGARRGLASFVQLHSDLLVLKGRGAELQCVLRC